MCVLDHDRGAATRVRFAIVASRFDAAAAQNVPEVVLDAPEVAKRLHEDFVCTAGMAAAATVPA
jgi:hypothetical protein